MLSDISILKYQIPNFDTIFIAKVDTMVNEPFILLHSLAVSFTFVMFELPSKMIFPFYSR